MQQSGHWTVTQQIWREAQENSDGLPYQIKAVAGLTEMSVGEPPPSRFQPRPVPSRPYGKYTCGPSCNPRTKLFWPHSLYLQFITLFLAI